MADHQQKTAEAAVGDQKQPPGETPARYSTEQVGEAVAFLKEIKARLEGAPSVRDELLDLLVGFGAGHGERHAVTSRASELLREHPDVLDMFNAFLTGGGKPPVPPPESLAASRPRRRPRRNSSVPAEEKPDVSVVSAGAGDRSGRARLDDPQLHEALAFLRKVEEIAGKEAWENFVELLGDVRKDADLDAGEIYRRASGVLGAPEHAGGLLHEFATRFLPGVDEWEAQQQEARRRDAAAKKTRRAAADHVGGDRRQHPIHAGGRSGGRAQFDTNVITLEIVKKRHRADDGDHRRQDDSYGTPVKIKKPRTDEAGFSGTHAGADVDKKPRRRTANSGEGCSAPTAPAPAPPPPAEQNDPNALFRRFRELWVFYTHYSTMVETMDRAEELLAGDAELPLTVEKMFPCRHHREFLQTYYAGHWGRMNTKLEGGGATAAAALEALLESLQRKEEEAVAEEVSQWRRRDAARAIERLIGLVMDKVKQEEERRRLDAGDGGALGRHVGHRR